jgi:tRNA A-37 threonylcarbamoyl transferase component Bud32
MELNIEIPQDLEAYLRPYSSHFNQRPSLTKLDGGVSNRTVLVEWPDGEAWVLKQALPKLRVDVDWFCDPARSHREALGTLYLSELAPPGSIMPLIFEDPENYLFAMSAVSSPHKNWKSMLLDGNLRTHHIERFATLIGLIHGNSIARAEELELDSVFADTTVFEKLRIEPYYLYTGERVPRARDFLHMVAEETRAHRQVLVHGDYSPKNILVEQDASLVLLDHEVIHWGDPAFDMGFSLAHFLSKANHLLPHRRRFCLAASTYWAVYWNTLGDAGPQLVNLESRVAWHTLACLLARVAGRSQLEYLTAVERKWQLDTVLEMLSRPPSSIASLTLEFGDRLNCYANNQSIASQRNTR